MADDDLRAVISGLVAGVPPADPLEAADKAGILSWIASGQPAAIGALTDAADILAGRAGTTISAPRA